MKCGHMVPGHPTATVCAIDARENVDCLDGQIRPICKGHLGDKYPATHTHLFCHWCGQYVSQEERDAHEGGDCTTER